MVPKDPKDPKDQGATGGADDAGKPAESAPAEPDFLSMEGPDIETPTGENGDGLSAEDLSFLADVSAGAATEPIDKPADQESEHLADLKRVSAEYANYRRRTEANRQVERDRAVGEVVKLLLPVLDDLDRAEKHGDLVDGAPLTAIAQKLRTSGEKIGLVVYGQVGDAFDPSEHEAIFQKSNPEVAVATVADVVERGYRIGDATLRVARVVVDLPE